MSINEKLKQNPANVNDIIKNVIEKRVAKVSDDVGTKPRLNQNSPNIFGQWMGQTEKPKKNIEK